MKLHLLFYSSLIFISIVKLLKSSFNHKIVQFHVFRYEFGVNSLDQVLAKSNL